MIFGGDGPFDFPLKCLNLSDNTFVGVEGLKIIATFLKSKSTLKNLHLNCTRLGHQGVTVLASMLDEVSIDKLHIKQCCSIKDKGIERLLLARNARYLKELDLGEHEFESYGYNAISQFLQNDQTILQRLNLHGIGPNKECAQLLVNSLTNNKYLQDLELGHPYVFPDEEDLFPNTTTNDRNVDVMPDLTELVCNLSNFESLCQSNHQLHNFGNSDCINQQPSSLLQEALCINERAAGFSDNAKMRYKLRTFYFRGHYDM